MAVDRLVERDGPRRPLPHPGNPAGQAVPIEQLPRVEGVGRGGLCGARRDATATPPARCSSWPRHPRRAGPADPPGPARPARRGRARRAPRAGTQHRRRAVPAHAARRCWPDVSWRRARTAARPRSPAAPADALARELGWDQQRLGLELERFGEEARAEGVVPSCWRRTRPSGASRRAPPPRFERPAAHARRVRAGARARRAPLADGRGQRLAGLLQRRGPVRRSRRTPGARPRELLDDGADVIDIGGESATTGTPPVAVG